MKRCTRSAPGSGLEKSTNCSEPAGHRPHAGLELHARPLLDVVAVAGEVDARDRPDAPFRIGEAARVAVDDRVVGHARAERVVACAVRRRPRGRAARPRRRVGPPRRAPACGGGADLDRVARDPAAARALGDALELVGGLVDRLQVALVRDLLAGRGQVGVPDLGLAAARELHVALVERRLELQEEQRLLDIEDLRHDFEVIGSGPRRGSAASAQAVGTMRSATPPLSSVACSTFRSSCCAAAVEELDAAAADRSAKPAARSRRRARARRGSARASGLPHTSSVLIGLRARRTFAADVNVGEFTCEACHRHEDSYQGRRVTRRTWASRLNLSLTRVAGARGPRGREALVGDASRAASRRRRSGRRRCTRRCPRSERSLRRPDGANCASTTLSSVMNEVTVSFPTLGSVHELTRHGVDRPCATSACRRR